MLALCCEARIKQVAEVETAGRTEYQHYHCATPVLLSGQSQDMELQIDLVDS